MNIAALQASLRRVAAEREWQTVHTPKNLAMALLVQAAELAAVFQWLTPEESRRAHADAASKQRIGDAIAGVLTHLLQMADHTRVDLDRLAADAFAADAPRDPTAGLVAAAPPVDGGTPDTHILLDFENVQPTAAELRTMVPEATRVWVFHGPHQKRVGERFDAFGTGMTAVPISKVGKNALDFHLSFYMGYIASRHQHAKFVVVANDKGYEPMLAHARSLGFSVQRHGHAAVKKATAAKKVPPAKKAAARKAVAKKAVAKKAAAKKVPAKKLAAKVAAPNAGVKRAPARNTTARNVVATEPAVEKASAKAPATKPPGARKAPAKKAPAKKAGAAKLPPAPGVDAGGAAAAVSTAMLQKLAANLQKMGGKRPGRHASLRRALKPLLGADASSEAIDAALRGLIDRQVVVVSASGAVTYPSFAPGAGTS